MAHRPSTPSSRPSRARRRRPIGRTEAGFTLIELMIVVVIIGISAALLAPAMSRSMSINRTNRCQYDAARLFRAARANAIGTGRAHLVHSVTTVGDYRLETYIGDSSSCARSGWAAIIVPATTPVDEVRETTYTTSSDGVRLGYQAAAGFAAPRQVCFEPQGDRYERPGVSGAFTLGPNTLVFTIDRLEAGALAGDPQRSILMPQFGTARVFR
ncbi:MAG: type II secretion system protein [Deltaproteobacteria bacterium]|nr:type II secretion system protein [Deltaproteobacteria bacterium]